MFRKALPRRARRARLFRSLPFRRPILELLEARVLPSTVNETESNNSLLLANLLSFSHDPAGSNYFTAYGKGAFNPANDVDYWKFSALAGDRVTIAGEGGSGNNSVYLELHNAADGSLTSASDFSNGRPAITNFSITTDGDYYVLARVYSQSNTLTSYTVRVDVARGFTTEAESNDTVGNAISQNSTLVLAPGASGHAVGKAAGTISTSADVDHYQLGFLRAGDVVNLSVARPADSTLDPRIQLLRGSAGTILATATGSGAINFTVTADDVYYAQVSANSGSTAGIYGT